jgi:hypothetical protein
VPETTPSGRSRLPKQEARSRYVEIGELVVLEQVRRDAEMLDDRSIAVGPFARLDANAVAARDGKTRGAITNLFGSQAAFQVETMALALDAAGWLERTEYPDPAAFATADEWVDAFFAGESARGPVHDAEPAVSYASLWALWLSTVPYGVWSETISEPSIAEQLEGLGRLVGALERALEQFDLTLRDGVTIVDLASAIVSLVEGVWLNQCLTNRHPSDPSEPIAALLVRSGRLLWHGAVRPR